ncbi:hypothetical protein KW791_01160 [Candidatus Parcubacteria bacterium]|nr:hypothetical protein [Candidatus Parcubacteria bacterium]
MAWIYLALFAYLLDSVVFIIDKRLLQKSIPHPSAYVFFVSLLSVFGLFLIPFGVHLVSTYIFFLAGVSGFAFFMGTLWMYHAMKDSRLVDAMPVAGALTALVTFVLSRWLLPEPTTLFKLLAFMLLVGGTFSLSYFHLSDRVIRNIVKASVALGVSYIALKLLFLSTNFVSGLFWSRSGMLLGGLSLLLFSKSRSEIVESFHNIRTEPGVIFILNKFLAGFAFVLLYYAVKIGSVAFVNALQGVQYIFILIFGSISTIMGTASPIDQKFNWRKGIATLGIVSGLILLFI